MEAKEKVKVLSGAAILLAMGVLVLLNSMGTWGLEKSWPVLTVVFALCTLVQSHRDAGGWIIGAAGLLFLFFENWFGQVSETTINAIRSAILVVLVFVWFKYLRKKPS